MWAIPSHPLPVRRWLRSHRASSWSPIDRQQASSPMRPSESHEEFFSFLPTSTLILPGYLHSGTRARCCVRLHQSHAPLDCIEPHRLHARIVPRFIRVPKCGIKYAAFPVISCPSDCEIFVCAMHARIIQVHFSLIQPSENTHTLAREILHLINLVMGHEFVRKCFHRRELRIFHNNGSVKRGPRMVVEIAPDHLSIFGPFVEGSNRRVAADKSFAVVANKREQVRFLLFCQFKLADAIKEDCVKIIQGFV